MKYPTTFAKEALPLTEVPLDDRGREALDRLRFAGFEAVAGLRRDDLAPIGDIAGTVDVREYCPNDLEKRFGSVDMAEGWHQKDGGRGVVILRQVGTGAIAGYGWTGRAGQDEKALIPGQEVTFAERLSPFVAGQGLGAPFAEVIVSSAVSLHGAKKIGLQTWGSNTPAVRTYLKTGAQLVTTVDDYRPTLTPTKAERNDAEHPLKRRDVRLFMKFPRTFM